MLGCKTLGVTLKNQAHNKISCIDALIFQVNFIMNMTPAQAFTPPAEKNMSTTSGGLS